MFGRRKETLREETDKTLIRGIDKTRQQWHRAQKVESEVDDFPAYVHAKTVLEKSKYLFLYNQARERAISAQEVSPEITEK